MEIRVEQDRTLKDLTPNVAALLCYVAGWISGIVFLILEQKNRFVRFHALQSIIVFGALTLAGTILGRVPLTGPFFTWIITLTGFILWIILMVKAHAGEVYKLPWAGNLAEKLTVDSLGSAPQAAVPQDSPPTPALPVLPAAPAPPVSRERSAKSEAFKERYYSSGARNGRVAASAFAIAWSVALIIFFNFFNQYIAYYHPVQTGGVTQWQMHTLVTSDFSAWLPIVTVALIISIIGHSFLISYDRYLLRQIVNIILDVFGVVVVVTLLSIYPFDFNVIPYSDAVYWIQVGVTVSLVLVAVGFGIGALVKFIQLIINTAEGKY